MPITVFLMAFAYPAIAQDLDKLKDIYQTNLASIVGQYSKEVAEQMNAYEEGLKTIREETQRMGNLDGLKAVLAEISRLNKDRSLPAEETETDPGVKTLAAAIRQGQRQAEIRQATRIVALAGQFDSRLGSLERSLTQQGDVNAATAIRDERRILQNTDTLLAAKALMAENSPKQSAPMGPTPGHSLPHQPEQKPRGPLDGKELSGTQKEDVVTVEKGQACTIKGEYVVPAGHTLVVKEGAQLVFARKASLSISGTLHAYGTTNNPIVCRGNGKGNDYWEGIRLNTCQDAVLSHVHLSDAASGVTAVSSKPRIVNCVIENCTVGVTAGAKSHPRIENCLIRKNNGNGITIEWSASATIEGCTIAENKGKGIEGGLYCGFDVMDSVIMGNRNGGIESRQGKVKSRGSVICDNGEFDVLNNGPHEWDFSGNYFGKRTTSTLQTKGDTASLKEVRGTVRLHGFLPAQPKGSGYKAGAAE